MKRPLRLLPLLVLPLGLSLFAFVPPSIADGRAPLILAQGRSQEAGEGGDRGGPGGPGGPGGMGRPPRMDFAAAASQLGVSEQALKDALGAPPDGGPGESGDRPPTGVGRGQGQGQGRGQGQGQGRGQGRGNRPPHPDFAAAASTLGVSEEALKDALWDNRTFPRLAEAATSLGISEATLKSALGIPTERPATPEAMEALHEQRPTLTEAAATLGISEDELKAALGVPANFEPGQHRDRGTGRGTR
ncbi:hypothetical protein [Prochlorothrix hollandica]|uniref:hypothetical protein n=1 Tax=Prochlorothrix hollandica TaxID=1223 RepID=UPI003340656C